MLSKYSSSFEPAFLDVLVKNNTFTNGLIYKDAITKCAGVKSCVSDSILTGIVDFGVKTKTSLTNQVLANSFSSI